MAVPIEPAPALAPHVNARDDDRFDAIERFPGKADDLWRAIGEAASRADLEALELLCQQLRFITLATFATVRGLQTQINQSPHDGAASDTRSLPL